MTEYKQRMEFFGQSLSTSDLWGQATQLVAEAQSTLTAATVFQAFCDVKDKKELRRLCKSEKEDLEKRAGSVPEALMNRMKKAISLQPA